MKKGFISYANDKTDLTTVPDFHNIILKLKSPIMNKLSFTHNLTHVNVVNTIYDDIIEDKVFFDEMIRMYNNILSSKLDNDDIDNNNNDVNTNNIVSNKRKSLKRKYDDDVDNKNKELNTKKVHPDVRKSRKKISASKYLNFDLNDNKNMSTLIKKTSMFENNKNKKNTKITNDIMTEKDYSNFKINNKERLVYFPRRLQ